VNGPRRDFVKWKARPHRAWALLLVALRSLLLVFALQFSGVVHDISDFVEAVVDAPEHAEHEQCPADGPCDDCPPGCPNCHCPAAFGSLAAEPPLAILPQLLALSLPASLDRTQAAPGPELPGLFKPPRA
jgi:hypothetical protein